MIEPVIGSVHLELASGSTLKRPVGGHRCRSVWSLLALVEGGAWLVSCPSFPHEQCRCSSVSRWRPWGGARGGRCPDSTHSAADLAADPSSTTIQYITLINLTSDNVSNKDILYLAYITCILAQNRYEQIQTIYSFREGG